MQRVIDGGQRVVRTCGKCGQQTDIAQNTLDVAMGFSRLLTAMGEQALTSKEIVRCPKCRKEHFAAMDREWRRQEYRRDRAREAARLAQEARTRDRRGF